MKAIILSAGKSSRLKELTKDMPKACLSLNASESVLSRMLKSLDKKGFSEATLIIGHAAEKIKDFSLKIIPELEQLQVKFLINDDYENKDNIYSVYLIKDLLADDLLVFNSDIVFDERILDIAINKMNAGASFLIIDDTKPLIDEDMKVLSENKKIQRISKSLNNESSQGEYIGIMHISSKDKDTYAKKLKELIENNDVKRHYEYALDQILSDIHLEAESTQGLEWTEIDTLEDLKRAQSLKCIEPKYQTL